MKPTIDEGNFHDVINKAMNEKCHVDYLKKVRKDYENYKKFFDSAIIDRKQPPTVYKFKVEYLLKKPVWRIFEICGVQDLDIFAEAIIDSMQWCNDHMHGFSFPTKKESKSFYVSPYTFYANGWEDDPHPTYKTDQIKIDNIDYAKFPKLRFEFDYGDGHLFDIHFLSSRPLGDREAVDEFPRLTDLRGVAPEQYPFCDD
jgi:hypothetical protein